MRGGGDGDPKSSNAPGRGNTLNFSYYVDLDQASTVYPQKYQKYQAYPQNN